MRSRLGERTVVLLTVLLIAAPAMTVPAVLSAQDTDRKAPPSQGARSAAQEFLDSVRGADSIRLLKQERTLPSQCRDEAALPADSVVMRGCRDAWAQYFAYQRFALAHREGVFRWQLLSSEITFVVVVFLVLVGVFFSWLQFTAELPRSRQAGRGNRATEKLVGAESAGVDHDAQEVVVRTQSAGQVKAGPEGIEVSSPVLGVIILTLSLLFFYLYLKFVYPIHETF